MTPHATGNFRLLASAGIFVVLIALGCGRADLELHTTIETSGGVLQEVSIKADGVMATALQQAIKSRQELASSAWKADTRLEGGKLQFTASRYFAPGEPVAIDLFTESANPQSASLSSSTQQTLRPSYSVKDDIFKIHYAFEYAIPVSATPTATATDPYAQAGAALVNSMFSFTWKLTVPGKIINSNADSVEGNTASWVFDLKAFQEGRTMTLEAEYTKTPVLVGVGVVALAALGGAFALGLALARRRRPTSEPPVPSSPQ